MKHTNSDPWFTIQAQRIRILRAPEDSSREETSQLAAAVATLAEQHPDSVILDFHAAFPLSSTIIALAFLAVEAARPWSVPIALEIPVRHRNALLATGITNFVEVRLCG